MELIVQLSPFKNITCRPYFGIKGKTQYIWNENTDQY